VAGASAAMLAMIAACGGRIENGETTPASGAAAGSGGAAGASGRSGSGGTINGGEAGMFGNAGTGGDGLDASPDYACPPLVTDDLERRPLDMFILLDQSGSMSLGVDRWTPITTAIKNFVLAPEAAGTGLGIGYFGVYPDGPLADPTTPPSCEPSDYERPDVPITVLPDARPLIVASLDAHHPAGETPTTPALQGTMRYALAWAAAHPERRTVVVLITDSEPQGCTGNDVPAVAKVAAAALASTPSVETHVIGIGNVTGIFEIAQAGGTTATIVPDGQDANSGPFTLEVLHTIRKNATLCEFVLPVPAGQALDFDHLHMVYQPTGGEAERLGYVGERGCTVQGGGWYYVASAHSATLCPFDCERVLLDGTVRLELDCQIDPPPP
jgi:hypothetical protein